MSDLISRLLEAIEETERIAREACDPRAPAGGEHWRWVYAYIHDPRVDQEVDVDACREYLGDDSEDSCADVALRSVEQYPSNHVGLLPSFAVSNAEEQKVGPARHIARHDPSSVLRHCQADKTTVLDYQRELSMPMYAPGRARVVGTLRGVVERIAFAYGITEEET